MAVVDLEVDTEVDTEAVMEVAADGNPVSLQINVYIHYKKYRIFIEQIINSC